MLYLKPASNIIPFSAM